jgi:kynurenine formamidase
MTIEVEKLPSYAKLPVKPGAPAGSAWGLFGDDDQLGCLNLLTPERAIAAAKLVRKGAVFPLNLRIDQPNPPLFGRGAPRVEFVEIGEGVARDDYIDNFWPQASSQWDSLRHILHPRDGFYNGVKAEEVVAGGGKLGIENIALRGIAGRGVLLDVARHLEHAGQPLDYTTNALITREVLSACADAQGVSIQTGDILVIRTGWLNWYLNEATAEQKKEMAGDAMTQLKFPGIGPDEEIASYLWDLHIAAVAADNPALEAWPPGPDSGGFLHFRLIPLLGMNIGEFWYLEDLAGDCAADGVYEFMLTSAPLNVPGGVGSPPNALAIK